MRFTFLLLSPGTPVPPNTLAASELSLPVIAAMAVLVLRELGIAPCNGAVGSGYRAYSARVQRIAAHDTHRPSAEWSPHPLPTKEQPWPAEPRTVEEDEQLAAVAAICSAPLPPVPHSHVTPTGTYLQSSGVLTFGGRLRSDVPRGTYGLSLAERVAIVACWLLEGERFGASAAGKQAMIDVLVACDSIGLNVAHEVDAARQRVEASRRALAEEREKPGVLEARWSDGRWCDVTEVPDECGAEPEEDGPQLCIVRSDHPDALELGFCVAPVVVRINTSDEKRREPGCQCTWEEGDSDCPVHNGMPEPHNGAGQVTIAGWAGPDGHISPVSWRTKDLDFYVLRKSLNSLEYAAWSALVNTEPVTSLGTWEPDGDRALKSPSLGGTRLSVDTIVGEVLRCLT